MKGVKIFQMKVEQLPVFAKFVFSSENSDHCVSTTDINALKFVKYRSDDGSIYRLEKGHKIYFEGPDKENIFEILSITIEQITDDLEAHQYGFDSEDCTHPIGDVKEFLFKVMVKMKLIS